MLPSNIIGEAQDGLQHVLDVAHPVPVPLPGALLLQEHPWIP